MIIDSTITGSGKNGILLTTKALYLKDVLAKTAKFSFDNMPALMSARDEKSEFFKLVLNDISINVLFDEKQTADLLIFIMQYLVNGFKFINKIRNC